MARDKMGTFVLGALVGAALTYFVLKYQPMQSQWLERVNPQTVTIYKAALFP